MSCSQRPQGQGQRECKKINSQALKKPLKQECCADLFYSVKGQLSLALYYWCAALHALKKTWMRKGKKREETKQEILPERCGI